MNYRWKFLGFFLVILVGHFISMGGTVDVNENEKIEKESSLVRKKRFVCGGVCIATVVFGVISMVGLGTDLANKEHDGALFRPSIRGLKIELQEEDSRISDLKREVNADAEKMEKYKRELEGVSINLGVWEDKLNKMKLIYEDVWKQNFIDIHDSILHQMSQGFFNLNTFQTIWKVQADLMRLQQEHQKAVEEAMSSSAVARTTMEIVGYTALDALTGGLISSIQYSDQKKERLTQEIKQRRKFFNILEKCHHGLIIQSRKLECRREYVDTINIILSELADALGELNLTSCRTTRETLEVDVMEITTNWEDIIEEFERELEKVQKQTNETTSKTNKQISGLVNNVETIFPTPKEQFDYLSGVFKGHEEYILSKMSSRNLLPRAGFFLKDLVTGCSQECGGGQRTRQWLCLGAAPECGDSYHRAEQEVCNLQACPRDCPEGWLRQWGSCYKLSAVGLKKHEVENKCQTYEVHGKNATTMTVETSEEEVRINQRIQESANSNKEWFFKKQLKGFTNKKDVCFNVKKRTHKCNGRRRYHFVCERRLFSSWLLNKVLLGQCRNTTATPPATTEKPSQKCLRAVKGWDFTVIIKEEELNLILPEVFANMMSPHRLPDFEAAPAGAEMAEGQAWGVRTELQLRGLTVQGMVLAVREGQDHEGKLAVTFSSGSLRIAKHLVGLSQDLPPSLQDIRLAGKTFQYRIKVIAYNIRQPEDELVQEVYSVKLELDDYEPIIGHLDLATMSLFDADAVRETFARHMKETLNRQFELTRFPVHLKYPDQQDVAKNLFPKKIPLLWTFAPGNGAYITAVATTQLCLSCA